MAVFSSLGLASTLLPTALASAASDGESITVEMMEQAEKIAGLKFSAGERREVVEILNHSREVYQELRGLRMAPETPLSLYFNPLPPGFDHPSAGGGFKPSEERIEAPSRLEEVAFYPVTHLARLLKERKITSLDLTRMYLARLKKYDAILKCVVTLTEDLALAQAERADRETAAGLYRGPLHGIPWGVKDIFSTKGIPTTWGLERYKNRVIDTDATVVKKLEQAGAVLLAKLSLGEMATGDKWYGGRTRNPWNPSQGSGGSSAGSASAVAAGLVGFSLGTETNESLVGPAMVCGVTGLRPTFGRVSRHGVMTVSWSYDKVGPLARSAQDSALILDAIRGPDGIDRSVLDPPLDWPAAPEVKNMKVGYVRDLFELTPTDKRLADLLAAHREAKNRLEEMGVETVALKNIDHALLKKLVRVSSLGMMVEAAAAHEDLSLGEQGNVFRHSQWAKRFRTARYVPAIDFVQANRARSLLIKEVDRIFQGIDVLLGRITLSALQSNLTGHPELVLPHGLDHSGMPVNIILTGTLFGEAGLLNLAGAYQAATDYHRLHPDLA